MAHETPAAAVALLVVVVVPFPSCPRMLLPHDCTVPTLFASTCSTTVCAAPAVTAEIPPSPCTATGFGL